MKYANTIGAVFTDRPNRFIAHCVLENNETVTVHVKNTGRMKTVLTPGCEVCLSVSDNPKRKTAYDLIAAKSETLGWVNLDSQACNLVAKEFFLREGYDTVRAEVPFGESRMDFFLTKGEESAYVEVKGCTLAVDGIGYFPDAPTKRGEKHLGELIRAVEEGHRAAIAFVIPMNGIEEVRPHAAIDPAFSEAFARAKAAGVAVWFLCCRVEKDCVEIMKKIETP